MVILLERLLANWAAPSTISYEVKRGTVSLYHGKQQRYKAEHGQSVYQINRRHCGRKSDFLKKANFISYVIKHFLRTVGHLTFVPIVV
ncbi:Transposase [Lactobacillus crispatus]|uniref:Transposase n=1 Tax=Lactobacillus crispatus TaxID=47770 RepID=A0AAW4DRU2_9LACO|nr:Transposase [Lactobacillus crispatus]